MIDLLTAEELNAVRNLLTVMVRLEDTSLSHSLASAPVDEEEITEETIAGIDLARASLARGEGIPHEEILREFDLAK